MRRGIFLVLLFLVGLSGSLSAAAYGSPTTTIREHLGGFSFLRPAGWSVFPYDRLQTQFVTFLGCISSNPNPDTCGNAASPMPRGSITIVVSASSFLLPPGRKSTLGPGQSLVIDGHPARLRTMGQPRSGSDCAVRHATLAMAAIIGGSANLSVASSLALTACIRAPRVGVRMRQFEALGRSIRLGGTFSKHQAPDRVILDRPSRTI